jgi:hypothetical protein
MLPPKSHGSARIIPTIGLIFGIFVSMMFLSPPAHAAYATANWGQSLLDFLSGNLQMDGSGIRMAQAPQVEAIIGMIGPNGLLGQNFVLNDQLRQASVLGKTSDIIAYTYTTPPASTYAFVQDMGQTLGFIAKPTYAQSQAGIGFSGLEPLLPLWKAFRNIAYGILAIVMIVIGFMIMLRKKIDPKTVVTVQNALPRIIITLLLITFSYAIVGILIDLMYVVIMVVASIFSNAMVGSQHLLTTGSSNPAAFYSNASLLEVMANNNINPLQIVFGLNTQALSTNPLGTGASLFLNFIHNMATTGNWLQTLLGTIIGDSLGLFGALFLYLLGAIAMIYIFIRLVILFTSAYIQIVIALLIGPLQLMFEAVPGSTAFSSWFKNLIANLAVFPVGAGMFMLANVFGNFANSASGSTLWTPPYMRVAPFLTLANNTTSIAALVGFGLLWAIPSVAGSIKEALKAKSPVQGAGLNMGQVVQTGIQGFMFWQSSQQIAMMKKLAGAKGGSEG